MTKPPKLAQTLGALLLLSAWLVGCQSPATPPEAWALAIHGGAGTIGKDMPEDVKKAYLEDLEAALRVGQEMLKGGGTSLDAVEKVVMHLENNPRFNAGKGAVFNHAGGHELDASIMEGTNLRCGAVAGVQTVKNPIQLARRVMEKTRHVLLGGSGADKFAEEQAVTIVPNAYFSTERRRQQWQERLKKSEKGTVGAVALDRAGHLAAATSTGGLTDKQFGRIGDSPIIGAGTYANDLTCAISCTGTGEEFIRHGVARDISARMQHRKVSLAVAAREVVQTVLQPGDGGVIGVSRTGELVGEFNTEGMYRGFTNASGRFDVEIW